MTPTKDLLLGGACGAFVAIALEDAWPAAGYAAVVCLCGWLWLHIAEGRGR